VPHFSFDYQPPDPHEEPFKELMRLAQERKADIDAESFAPTTRRLICGDEALNVQEHNRIKGVARVLRCTPDYIAKLQVSHLRATGQPVPKLQPIEMFYSALRRGPKPVNKNWAAPPRQPAHYRPRTPKFSDEQILSVAHLTVEQACEELGCGATQLRERLRKLGFQPKAKGRKPRAEKGNDQI
jgi:hypothetical protein